MRILNFTRLPVKLFLYSPALCNSFCYMNLNTSRESVESEYFSPGISTANHENKICFQGYQSDISSFETLENDSKEKRFDIDKTFETQVHEGSIIIEDVINFKNTNNNKKEIYLDNKYNFNKVNDYTLNFRKKIIYDTLNKEYLNDESMKSVLIHTILQLLELKMWKEAENLIYILKYLHGFLDFNSLELFISDYKNYIDKQPKQSIDIDYEVINI